MKPSLGRIVHYRAPQECGGETYAAIVVRVHDDGTTCDLVTFGPHSMYHNNGIAMGAADPSEASGPDFGRWFWPPRV